MEKLVALGLCLKSLLRVFDRDEEGGCGREDDREWSPIGIDVASSLPTFRRTDIPQEMFNPLFVKAIVFIASRGTELSRDWTCKNLEIAGLTMYEKAGAGGGAAAGQSKGQNANRDNAVTQDVDQSVADCSTVSSEFSG